MWALNAAVSGGATVAVELSEVSGSSEYVGKYALEHRSALRDVAAATGFSKEHRSALRDLTDAGR